MSLPVKAEVADDKDKTGWLRFSQNRPNASPHVHQAAALLHSLEDSLRCFLCSDIFTIPVSIQPCNHAFCNDCIRKKLQEEKESDSVMRCPICMTPLDCTMDVSKCIVLNRNHEETARHYKTLRPVLKQAMMASQKVGINGSPTVGAAGIAAALAISKKRGPYKVKSRSSSVMNEDGSIKEPKPWKKKGNTWIREQFREEWTVDKETWSFVCIHCGEVGFRSKEKKWNATKLTEHITLKCTAVTPEMKQEAISHTQGAKRIKRMDEQLVMEQLDTRKQEEEEDGDVSEEW